MLTPLAEAAAELAALRQLLLVGRDGASEEWLAAMKLAINRAEARFRRLRGPDDRPDPTRGIQPATATSVRPPHLAVNGENVTGRVASHR